jgi:hypothetical protein
MDPAMSVRKMDNKWKLSSYPGEMPDLNQLHMEKHGTVYYFFQLK